MHGLALAHGQFAGLPKARRLRSWPASRT